MDNSYRPQSPDLSSYMPQSPDLSGLSAPPAAYDAYGQPLQHPQLQQHSRAQYGGPAGANGFPNAFATPDHLHLSSHPYATPQPLYHSPQHPQQHFSPPNPQLHYSMPTFIKPEDEEYLPPVPQSQSRSRRGRPPASNGSNTIMSTSQPHMLKAEYPDPTLGIQLKTSFPVARIKRIMQADEDIGKVAQVTPHVVSRALELFMIRLISASAAQAQGISANTPATGSAKSQRRVLSQHLKRVVMTDDTFDFLREIVGRVPDAPAKAKKEANSDSDESKPTKRRGKKRKDSGDDF